jgi:hypothetical protein
MSELVDVISGEFEEALEVKNPKSLHRGIFLLLSSSVPREEHSVERNDLKTSIMALSNNVELITMRMEDGFKRMDQRFEAVDKRFNRQTAMMSIGFLVITILITVYRFLG